MVWPCAGKHFATGEVDAVLRVRAYGVAGFGTEPSVGHRRGSTRREFAQNWPSPEDWRKSLGTQSGETHPARSCGLAVGDAPRYGVWVAEAPNANVT